MQAASDDQILIAFLELIVIINKIQSTIKKHTIEIMPTCPRCASHRIVKNGSISSGKKKFSCSDCKKQFVENPSNRTIKNEEWDIVDRLLLEKIPVSAISRAMNISRTWLHQYINLKKEFVSNIPFRMQTREKIYIEAGELWSFVGSKKNEAWIWLAIERKTRLIVGFFVGKRDAEGALGLWNSLSEDCRKNGIFLQTALKRTRVHFQKTETELSAKKAGKQALLNDSI